MLTLISNATRYTAYKSPITIFRFGQYDDTNWTLQSANINNILFLLNISVYILFDTFCWTYKLIMYLLWNICVYSVGWEQLKHVLFVYVTSLHTCLTNIFIKSIEIILQY